MEQENKWAVLLAVHKIHADHILSGEKKVELRKRVPRYVPTNGKQIKYPFRVYIYETRNGGGSAAVVGYFTCTGYVGTEAPYMETMAKEAMVTLEELTAYGGGGMVYAWKIADPVRLAKPVTLDKLGEEEGYNPPQSWHYIGPVGCKRLEREIGASQ